MDRKTILENGLLTQYILGELSQQETAALEKAVAADPQLQEELLALEADFERMGMENAITPPDSVRIGLGKKLDRLKDDTASLRQPVLSEKGFQASRLAIAASLAAIFAISSFWLYNQWQSAEEALQLVQQQTQERQQQLRTLEAEMDSAKLVVATLNNKNVIPIVLNGNQLLPEARAVAYVNHKAQSVVVNPQALPTLTEEETYQMWADVDGEMISMGLLPTDRELVSLTYIDRAASLNITIEPKGGSEHPTVERLISNVYL